MRIIQLSDTHISHLGGSPSRNMALLTDYLNAELRPDLVINTGRFSIKESADLIVEALNRLQSRLPAGTERQ